MPHPRLEKQAAKPTPKIVKKSKKPTVLVTDEAIHLNNTTERISSGCTLLDCMLGGGWAEGRMINVVGDKSTGKTLLAEEAIANFLLKHKDCIVRYGEAEAAFDISYAQKLGIDIGRIEFVGQFRTIEDMYKDLRASMKRAQERCVPLFYAVDSLDALSDDAELEREMGDATYGTGKAKAMGELFRRLIQPMSENRCTLFIISQIRDNIGATMGRKWKRSGGHAMDFYATQVVILTKLGNIVKTFSGITRPIGVRIKAYCDKNKAGMPFRECEFPLIFSYGIDDNRANAEFLYKIGKEAELGVERKSRVEKAAEKAKAGEDAPATGALAPWAKAFNALPPAEYRAESARIAQLTLDSWEELEKGFSPERCKYGVEGVQ